MGREEELLAMLNKSLTTTTEYPHGILSAFSFLTIRASLLEVSFLLILLTLTTLLADYTRKRRAYGSLPPGPPSSGWIGGNVSQFPKSEPWKTYAIWGSLYGSLFTLRIYTHRLIILSTPSAIINLLQSRSSIYSDRPQPYMYHTVVGRKHAVFNITSSSPRFKAYRRLLREELNPRAVSGTEAGRETEIGAREVMESEAVKFVRALKEKPERFLKIIRMNAGAVIMKLAYGYSVKDDDDFFLTTIEKAFDMAVQAARPGRWLADYFPILRLIPSWLPLPGGNFKSFGKKLRVDLDNLSNVPHMWVKKQISEGTNIPSFTSRHLVPKDGLTVDEEEEDTIKFVAAGLYAGGGDTVVSALSTFFLLMTLHPTIQSRAQAEVDAIVGRSRLPNVDDFERGEYKYVNALIKEILRWAPVAPLGLPHRVTQDDTYMGYWIPKHSIIIANIWAVMHDESIYSDPFAFKPERHLPRNSENPHSRSDGEPEMDPTEFVFGFGKRVCPGDYFARCSLFLTITSVLSCFDISKAVDANGKEVVPEVAFTTGTTSHVKPFECKITLRPDAEGLIAKV